MTTEKPIICLVLAAESPEIPTEEEIKEILMSNDGDLDRLEDFKDVKLCKGYLCKLSDYFRYELMDMDEVLLFIDDEGKPYSYEHSGNYSPTHKTGLIVVGLMDENAEIEAVDNMEINKK